MTDAEARTALEAAIAVAGKEKVMVAACSRGSVLATLELAGVATAAGYDAVALHAPAVGTGVEKRTYFEAVADRCALP